MWEKLTPDDIDRARHKLALERAETLSRHAQELRDLDIERGRIARAAGEVEPVRVFETAEAALAFLAAMASAAGPLAFACS
jgi:hypothetical protein